MKKLNSKFMMSLWVALMLGCSCICVSNITYSSHLTDIDTTLSTRLNSTLDSLTRTHILTDTLLNKKQDESQQFKSQLIASTLEYVSQVSKKTSCTDRELIAKEIVEVALENNIDINFILAQGTLETALGSLGIGKSRHSIFGVYKTYQNYKECIVDYIRILKKSYLKRGRTEYSLMKHYVTAGGARYASNPDYETELSAMYKRMPKKLRSLQKDIIKKTDEQEV